MRNVPFVAAAIAVMLCAASSAAAPARPARPLWVSAYYISGDAHSGRLPIKDIDFHAMSCIIHFCLFPTAQGGLNPSSIIPAADSAALLSAAHAAGCKVLVSLGSDQNGATIRSSVSDKYRARFVKTLVDFVVARGYDGLDLDYEPLERRDIPDFVAFSTELREALDAAKPGLLLTAAVASEPGMFAVIQNDFDQINLMTYDLSGQYKDFKSWYNSSLYGDPTQTMEHGVPYPSCDQMVRQFIQAGVRPSKLAIGIAFYGYVWTGVSGPRQTIQGKAVTIDDGADYRQIMRRYDAPALYHWDPVAKAPYLSIAGATPAASQFVSYDNRRLARDKVEYARKMGLGGVMIWELGGGFRGSEPPGRQDLLLQSVKQAWRDGSGQ